jgi:O-antigen chain-terminating methyltransferase
MDEHPDLAALRARLDEEERAYASLLAALDGLAGLPVPAQRLPELPDKMARLNRLWEAPGPPDERGLSRIVHHKRWELFAPVFQRQTEFNSTLVQVLNGYLEETAALHVRLAQVISTLVQYLQHVLPVMDARDRVSSALATTRAELVLEAFDRRQESLGRRLEGLLALRDRVEVLSEETSAIRSALAADAPPPAAAAGAAARAADDAHYVAFENRFRGAREDLRERLAGYVDLFADLAPVVDLGCGRGEFLELLRERGIQARGVEGNAQAVAVCRANGLDVALGDLVDFLQTQPAGSLGGVFAAQVVEHLPPAALQAMLAGAHRALRPGGLLVLETVNTRSVIGFLEVYLRDLTHRTPLHPDTLSFLAAAQGFTDVRVEMRSPVDPAGQLQPVPSEGLPPGAAAVLNENAARLNALLYGPQEYVLIARR